MMNKANKRTKLFTVLLSENEHAALVRMSAQRTLETGKRFSVGDVLRELAFGDPRATSLAGLMAEGEPA